MIAHALNRSTEDAEAGGSLEHGSRERGGLYMETSIKTKDKIYASTHHRQLEELTPAERAEELIIMGLRITEGINKKRFQQQCGLPLNSVVNNQSLETLKHSNLLIETPDTLRATPQGFVVLNKVIEDLCC